MRPLALFALSFNILSCMAQGSSIVLPPSGSNIKPNQTLVVQVERPLSHQGSTEVGMVIGLLQCQRDPCPDPRVELGTVLFNGKFNPQLHERPGRPYQNFTVTVPAFQPNFGTAKAQLTTGRFHMLGAGPLLELEVHTVALNIVFT